MSRAVMQQALEALEKAEEVIEDEYGGTSGFATLSCAPAITALRAALAEPQTTHWEGCEAVHPECRKQEPDGISWLKRDSGYFTAPTPRKPLTDEEMRECAQAMNAEPLAEGWPELIKFARAIERAHGIGGGE